MLAAVIRLLVDRFSTDSKNVNIGLKNIWYLLEKIYCQIRHQLYCGANTWYVKVHQIEIATKWFLEQEPLRMVRWMFCCLLMVNKPPWFSALKQWRLITLTVSVGWIHGPGQWGCFVSVLWCPCLTWEVSSRLGTGTISEILFTYVSCVWAWRFLAMKVTFLNKKVMVAFLQSSPNCRVEQSTRWWVLVSH